jgi:LAO/AO transport system kinase
MNNIAESTSAIRAGQRAAIAEALNLIDDARGASQKQASALLSELLRFDTSETRLIGITGPPGVGKSSLTAALIKVWRERELRVGVLAVDPSSPLSGGALLGDRLRMQCDGSDDGVFVRSLSNRGQFGWLSPQIWPMSVVMMSSFDVVLIETVGVGQREVDIASSCDTTCFVAQPGSGDSIQFLKAGVLEVPHVLVVNKLDMGAVAKRTLSELSGAIQAEHADGDWRVEVLATSATKGTGVIELADALERHHRQLLSSGALEARRTQYQASWVLKRLEEDYGRKGIEQLGGVELLLETLSNKHGNPIEQYAKYVQQILSGK